MKEPRIPVVALEGDASDAREDAYRIVKADHLITDWTDRSILERLPGWMATIIQGPAPAQGAP